MNKSLDTIGAARSAFVADVLRASGRLRLQVRGESMLPILWPRDVVEIADCSIEQARRGDVVLALREGRLFLHRFISRCQPSGFLLQGDSMPAPDPQYPDEALIGRLAGPPVRCADLRCAEQRSAEQRYPALLGARDQFAASGSVMPLGPWSWSIGRLLCYCAPARRLALKIHAVREQRDNVQKVGDGLRNAAIDPGVA